MLYPSSLFLHTLSFYLFLSFFILPFSLLFSLSLSFVRSSLFTCTVIQEGKDNCIKLFYKSFFSNQVYATKDIILQKIIVDDYIYPIKCFPISVSLKNLKYTYVFCCFDVSKYMIGSFLVLTLV